MSRFKLLDESKGKIQTVMFLVNENQKNLPTEQLEFEYEEMLRPFLNHNPELKIVFLCPYKVKRNDNFTRFGGSYDKNFKAGNFGIRTKLKTGQIALIEFDLNAFQQMLAPSFFPNANLEDIFVETAAAWVQDPFLVMEDSSGQPVLLDSIFNWRNSVFSSEEDPGRYRKDLISGFLPTILSQQMDWPVISTKFFFEGGNVLGGTGLAFIGISVLIRNWIDHRPKGKLNDFTDFKKFTSELAKKFHSEQLLVPGLSFDGDMPLFLGEDIFSFDPLVLGYKHLDQWMAYLGRRNSKHLVAIAEEFVWKDKGSGEYGWMRQDSRISQLQHYLDLSANWFQVTESIKDNFEVVRVPTFAWRLGHLFGTNIHQHHGIDERVAFCSKFSVNDGKLDPELFLAESMVEGAYENAGFKVEFIEGSLLANSSAQHAGLHCLMKVIQRG